jgi:hypothetical protein
MSRPATRRWRRSLVGVLAGASYGLLARFMIRANAWNDSPFTVMTLGFLFLVPVAMGYITVAAMERPTWRDRLIAPWGPCALVALAAALFAWEGAICIVMALPVMLAFSSLGGFVARAMSSKRYVVAPIVALLPWAVMPAERGLEHRTRYTTSVSEITIAAPPAIVWPLVVSVDTILPAEQRRALFTSMGFPRPIAATIDRSGVGGVRTATFERGVVFREAVTEWIPERRLRFTIDPIAVPDGALDPHVTIGGPYFDVLNGTYELHALDGGRTRLVLKSEHRTSTAFNLYAAWWADRVMASIQRNILAVLRDRAERARLTEQPAE